MVQGPRPAVIILLILAVCSISRAGIDTPLEALDLGEGLFAPEDEFGSIDADAAKREIAHILQEPSGTARHLQAIKAYQRSLPGTERATRLRELATALRADGRAGVETAFTLGLLALDEGEAARDQDLKEIAVLLGPYRNGRSSDPWAHLTAAALYGTFPELLGNWNDEALYALCYGFDDPRLLLAAGSLILTMDLSYGGNERLQWFAFLALSRAEQLMPDNGALRERIKALVRTNLAITGYRPSRWLRQLAS